MPIENVQAIAEYGAQKVVIPRIVADEVQADLIIYGAIGHSTMERFFMGSVSEAIVRTAKCDVLVVRTEKDK